MAHETLNQAKLAKIGEFYTQWEDIEREVQSYIEYDPDVFRGKTVLCPCDDPEWSNFTKYFALHFREYGLKKLISTSYAVNSKQYDVGYQLTLFETDSPKYDETKTRVKGKIFVLDSTDMNEDGIINIDDLRWDYMDDDGDFRSDEVKRLRDEADIIITNPPFSLFREFLAWIVEAEKQFLIIGNMNAITYKEVFPLLRDGKAWLGTNYRINGGAMYFEIPESIVNIEQVREVKKGADGKNIYITRVQGVRWYTNMDHGRRHQELSLMTMDDNVRFSKHKDMVGKTLYVKYDNYDAIEIPYVEAIPKDYPGIMGVPVSILDKYCPDQFEILGSNRGVDQDPNGVYGRGAYINGKEVYKRLFIRHKGAAT